MNPAHVHLLLNHLPLIGSGIGILLLVVGAVRKSGELKKTSLWIFVIAALVAIPVFLTGEPAEHIVEHLPGVAEPIIEQHEQAALFSLIAMEALGVISLAGLFVSRRSTDVSKLFAAIALGVSIIAAGSMGWTANLGGQIRHSEIRSGAGSNTTEGGDAGEQHATPRKESHGEN